MALLLLKSNSETERSFGIKFLKEMKKEVQISILRATFLKMNFSKDFEYSNYFLFKNLIETINESELKNEFLEILIKNKEFINPLYFLLINNAEKSLIEKAIKQIKSNELLLESLIIYLIKNPI